MANESVGNTRGSQPIGAAKRTPAPPPAGSPPKGAPGTQPLNRDTATLKPQARPADPLLSYPVDKEKIVQDLLAEPNDSLIGNAVAYWHDERKQPGFMGYVGATAETLLEFSGLPSVERSAAELGARVGVGDSAGNIALTSGKLAFHAGMVLLNALVVGKVVTSAARGLGLAAGAVRTAPTVVRHYTSAAAAEAIMKDGVLLASKSGFSGGNKIYMLADEGAGGGMNFLRRLNIGIAGEGNTARAIEIDLTKLSPELLQAFKVESQRGILNLEHFVTHTGGLNLKELGAAVRVVDTQALKIGFDQLLKSGGRLLGVSALFGDVQAGASGLANTAKK